MQLSVRVKLAPGESVFAPSMRLKDDGAENVLLSGVVAAASRFEREPSSLVQKKVVEVETPVIAATMVRGENVLTLIPGAGETIEAKGTY